jgi:2-amino-4-hydroxy-6-hydroxymethyldihydropteridine diphosphokinase
MPFALVSLGANLGDRAGTLEGALGALGEHPQIAIAAVSSFHETAPIGGPAGQPAFLNGAALMETSLTPRGLLSALEEIELRFGRERDVRWGARSLDLDLLLYDEIILEEADLTLPHPRMAYRRFVLEPAAEVAPQMRHPGIGWTMTQLLNHLNAAPHYLAITSIGKDTIGLAGRLSENSGATYCPDPGRSRDALRDALPELAQRRSNALRECLALATEGVVSDFWIEQQQAYLDAAELKNLPPGLQDRFDAVVRDAPCPKLLVLLENRQREPLVGDRISLGDRLHALVTRPARGPFLVLDAADSRRNLEELTAALTAMR